jgi:hypothetical protein
VAKARAELDLDAAENAHEWVSFEDPEEERTWVFDVTFMLSHWGCIFGRGCQGVLTEAAPELVQGCCSYGAHFVDAADRRRVERVAKTLTDEQWQFRRKGLERGIIKQNKKGESMTRLVDGACIFLNRPGFPAGPGCAFHQVAIERGVPHLTLKPDVCWQLPLRRDEQVHDDGHVTSTIRQWDRRHWGGGGSEFHWWCTEAPESFVEKEPVYKTLRDELIALTTPAAYGLLTAYLDARVRRPNKPLPHPAERPVTLTKKPAKR